MFSRAPFIGMVLGGALLFFALSSRLPFQKEMLRVDARTLETIVERKSNALGEVLTESERREAVAEHVQQEILLREAYRRGRHLQLQRVRERLALSMRTALVEEVSAPTEAELQAFFNAREDAYSLPESVSWSHVFFVRRGPGDLEDSTELLAELRRGGEDFRAMGDPFPAGPYLERTTRARVANDFGESFADALFAVADDGWYGPLTSSHGTHYVRLEERIPKSVPGLAAVRRYVELDWRTERSRSIFERKLQRIRDGYVIRVAGR